MTPRNKNTPPEPESKAHAALRRKLHKLDATANDPATSADARHKTLRELYRLKMRGAPFLADMSPADRRLLLESLVQKVEAEINAKLRSQAARQIADGPE